ncbi:hypothetical protein [Deinococcus sp. NW-56]|uniref:hypothetical protein n=1 Tax=Deinococcus sp. NW-56 TaxID=2080419 RepID=UPI000CF37A11|nr:hypothetical protein [Deinococcus sp. NW-56]
MPSVRRPKEVTLPWYPAPASVPPGLHAGEFCLRPLRATAVQLDHDAVIASREDLLVSSGGRWPAEGFSLADNLADLERHEREHQERAPFPFTVMNPQKTR